MSEPTVGTFVFSGPLAPDHSMWPSAEAAPGFVTTSVREIGGITCPVHVYTPDTSGRRVCSSSSMATDWFEGLDVARACEAAGLPPIVIIGIGARSRALRVGALGGNREFLKQVTDEAAATDRGRSGAAGLCAARPLAADRWRSEPGGLSALLMDPTPPQLSVQSSHIHRRSGGIREARQARPISTDSTPTRWLTCQFSEAKRPEVEFHLAVGSRD